MSGTVIVKVPRGKGKGGRNRSHSAKSNRSTGSKGHRRSSGRKAEHKRGHTPRPQSRKVHPSIRQRNRIPHQALATARGGVTAALKGLVYQTMDPTNAPMIRLPTDGSSFQSVGTALCKNFLAYRLDFSVPIPDAHHALLPAGGGQTRRLLSDSSLYPVIVLRDPIVSFIDIIANDGGTNGAVGESTYICRDLYLRAGDGNTSFSGNGATGMLSFGHFVPVRGHTLYGELIPSGTMELGGSLVWLDAGTNTDSAGAFVDLFFTGATGHEANIIIWICKALTDNDRETVEMATVTEPTAGNYSARMAIESSGYYMFQVALTASWGVNWIAMEINQRAGSVTRHHVCESYSLAQHQIEDARVLGQSILLTNSAAAINLQGAVYASTMQEEVPWFEYVANMNGKIIDVGTALRYQGDWKKGFYGYVKPNKAASMELQKTYVAVDGNRFSAFRPFRNLGSFAVLVTRGTAIAGSGTASSVSLMATRSLEFTTSSQMYDVRPPSADTKSYEGYIQAMRSADMFFENPMHWSDIANFVKHAASYAGNVLMHNVLPAMAGVAAASLL